MKALTEGHRVILIEELHYTNEFLMDNYELEFKWLTIQPFGGPTMENVSNTKSLGNKW